MKLDELAKQYFTDPLNTFTYSLSSPFLDGSFISIRDPYSRITKDFKHNLLRHSSGFLAETQMAKSLKISESNLSLIDWNNFSRTYKKQTKSMQSFITKSIYNQLPTIRRQFKWGKASNDTCPLCNGKTENETHLFQCTHSYLQQFRRKQLKLLRDELTVLQTSPFLQRHIMRIILQWSNGFTVKPIPINNHEKEACQAINDQIKVGVGNMMKGILVWRLSTVQQTFYLSIRNFQSKGETWSKKLIQLFFQISHAIWCTRCDKVSESANVSYEDRIRQECSTMMIKLRQSPTSLPVQFRHLLNRKPHFTKTATTRALTSWLN